MRNSSKLIIIAILFLACLVEKSLEVQKKTNKDKKSDTKKDTKKEINSKATIAQSEVSKNHQKEGELPEFVLIAYQ